MRKAGLAVLLVVAACDGDPGQAVDAGAPAWGGQAAYSYAGCPEQDDTCPRLGTFYCALEKIRQAHAACSADADCAASPAATGCVRPCPAAVASSQLQAYQAAVQAEEARYCGASGDGGVCGASDECFFFGPPRCQQGLCAMPNLPDGGFAQ